MIKQIAVDPELFCQWEHHRALRNEFAVERGRLIAQFPKKWKALVRDLIEKWEREERLPTMKANTIRNWLSVPSGGADTRFIRSRADYDGNEPWRSNAEVQAEHFDLILSHQEFGVANAILADPDLDYLTDPRFKIDTQNRVPRNAASIVECVWPLVRISTCVRIVEPNFVPSEVRFMRPLERLVDRLFAEQSPIKLIELHVSRPAGFSNTTIRNFYSQIDPILRSGYQLRVFFWADGRERLHERYLLTDCGGIESSWGWDEGAATETTPVKILEESIWKKEWNRYQIGSPDFQIDPDQHVLLIGIPG
jgi:hypothetical protein